MDWIRSSSAASEMVRGLAMGVVVDAPEKKDDAAGVPRPRGAATGRVRAQPADARAWGGQWCGCEQECVCTASGARPGPSSLRHGCVCGQESEVWTRPEWDAPGRRPSRTLVARTPVRAPRFEVPSAPGRPLRSLGRPGARARLGVCVQRAQPGATPGTGVRAWAARGARVARSVHAASAARCNPRHGGARLGGQARARG